MNVLPKYGIPRGCIQIGPSFCNANVVPSILSAVARDHGSVRGRSFILTQQKLGAEEAEQLGVANDIVAAETLLDRACEIAADIVKPPPLTPKFTRIGFTQRLRRIVDEGITAAEVTRTKAAAAKA